MSEVLCKYYDVCGGCSLQHLTTQEYEHTKRAMLVNAVTRLGGGDAQVAELVTVGPRSRRRVEFKVSVAKGEVRIGFYGHRTHALVDIDDCPVTNPAITALIRPLREFIRSLKKPGHLNAISITSLPDGLDVYCTTRTAIPAPDSEKWQTFCTSHPAGSAILRLAMEAESDAHTPQLIYDEHKARVCFGDVDVMLPLAPFLQATQAGQDAITALVLQHMDGHHHIVDLYSGCGTYSFPLAVRGHMVSAYEGNAEMANAAHNAAKQHELADQMQCSTRDLYKRPLRSTELTPFNAAVINPPRNGATPQVKELAGSGVACIVMVSCNPATFERDARLLLEAGYVLKSATPIDQFYQSRHLELVAVFGQSVS